MNIPPPLARMRQFAPLALVLVSATVAVAAYLQALNYPFYYDDLTYISENTKLAGLHLTFICVATAAVDAGFALAVKIWLGHG